MADISNTGPYRNSPTGALLANTTALKSLASVPYRIGLTVADVLPAPSTPTVADVATGGVLLPATGYYFGQAAYNKYGTTTPAVSAVVTTANDGNSTHVVRATLAAVSGATGYDIFCSAAVAPLWVARISEAQRAAGCTITAVGTVSATTPGAGIVDVRVIGTGVATSANPFAFNTASTVESVPPINFEGFTNVRVHQALSVTDLRALATCVLAYWVYEPTIGAWDFSTATTLAPGTSAVTPMRVTTGAAISGPRKLAITVQTITGQGTSVDLYVQTE